MPSSSSSSSSSSSPSLSLSLAPSGAASSFFFCCLSLSFCSLSSFSLSPSWWDRFQKGWCGEREKKNNEAGRREPLLRVPIQCLRPHQQDCPFQSWCPDLCALPLRPLLCPTASHRQHSLPQAQYRPSPSPCPLLLLLLLPLPLDCPYPINCSEKVGVVSGTS